MWQKRFFCILLIAPQLLSAEEKIKTDTIIVFEDPSQLQEATATYAKEIYTDTDIKKSGSTTLFDYLSQHTSLNILPNFGDKTKPLIDMRGYGIEAGYQNVVINVDGQRINNIDNDSQMIGIIPLSSIKKIEIVRGSGSVTSGDGAMAGVINIITKNVTETSFKTTFGSNGQEIYNFNSGFGNNIFNLSVNLNDERLDGYSSPDTKNKRDQVDNKVQTIKLNLNPISDLKISLGFNSARNNNYLVGPLTKNEFLSNPKQNGGNQYSNYDYDIDRLSFKTNYQFSQNVSFMIDYFDEDKSQHAITSFNNDTYDYDYEGYAFIMPYQNDSILLKTGVQFFNGDRKDSIGTVTKDSQAVFLDTEISDTNWLSENLILSAGFRYEEIDYDWNDGASIQKTSENLNAWDIGFNYKVNNNFNIFSNYSHAYQAPDVDRFFVAQFAGPGFIYSGRSFNSFLDPARADTINLGINLISKTNQLQAIFFYSKIENEIVFHPNSFKNVNIDNSKKYGLEIFNQLIINNNLKLNLSYNYIKAEIGSNAQGFSKGKNMPGVPQNTIIANLNYKFLSHGNLNINHAWKERTYIFSDFDNNASQKQPAFISTNLSINYIYKANEYVQNINLHAGINNIFQHKNAVQGFVDSLYPFNFSRTWFAGVEANF